MVGLKRGEVAVGGGGDCGLCDDEEEPGQTRDARVVDEEVAVDEQVKLPPHVGGHHEGGVGEVDVTGEGSVGGAGGRGELVWR